MYALGIVQVNADFMSYVQKLFASPNTGSTQIASGTLLTVILYTGFWNSVKIIGILVVFPNRTTEELFNPSWM